MIRVVLRDKRVVTYDGADRVIENGNSYLLKPPWHADVNSFIAIYPREVVERIEYELPSSIEEPTDG